jgi:hypothetical protein
MGGMRIACNILVGKPEGKRSLEKHKRRWEDNIKMDLKEIGWEGVDRIHLAQGKDQWLTLLKMVMKLRVP